MSKTKEGTKLGRPTKYDPMYCEQMLTFFNIDPITYTTDDDGKEITKISHLPLLGKFAADIGVTRSTLYEWTNKHPEFSDTYNICKQHQENILTTNALLGNYNGSFSIFTAKNILGWRDKTEEDKDDRLEGSMIEIIHVNDNEKEQNDNRFSKYLKN
jgi:hypothetical protein